MPSPSHRHGKSVPHSIFCYHEYGRGRINGIDLTHARTIAEHIRQQIVELDKVYVDRSQNEFADTLAAPYSVQPWHIPRVSTPIGMET